MKYPIIFTAINAAEFEITVPDLPGCKTVCKSMDEGFDLIKSVIENHLTILAEYGETIPHAKPISVHQQKYLDVIWAMLDIDITPYLGKSQKINVTLPELLIKQIDDRVSKCEEYKTRSGFIATACLAQLKKS